LDGEVVGNKLLVLLTLGGLISGLLTCALMSPGQDEAGLYCGVVFGTFLSVPLTILGILDSGILYTLLKALGLIVVSTAAYYLAFFTAFVTQLSFRQIVPSGEQWNMGTNEPASAIGLFVGGLVGGFLVFAGVMYLSRHEISKGARARKIIQGTILGGALGIAGWALRSSIGVAIWNLLHTFGLTPSWELSPRLWFGNNYDYGERSRMYSLYVVWQTGVAAAAGFMLRHASVRSDEGSENKQLFRS
jgi:hypothetical protein